MCIVEFSNTEMIYVTLSLMVFVAANFDCITTVNATAASKGITSMRMPRIPLVATNFPALPRCNTNKEVPRGDINGFT